MIILLLIIWLLLGIIAVWRCYFGLIKEWWVELKQDIRKHQRGNNVVFFLLCYSPIFIMGGGITLLIFETGGLYTTTWYYKLPKKIKYE